MHFYQLVKRIRIERHMTMKSIARFTGINPSTWKNWENCRNLPNFFNIDALKTCFPEYTDELEAAFRERKLIDPREWFEAWKESYVSESTRNSG